MKGSVSGTLGALTEQPGREPGQESDDNGNRDQPFDGDERAQPQSADVSKRDQ